MKKKNIKIINVSLSKGIDWSNAETRTQRPSIPEIVLNGHSTQNDLKTPKLREVEVTKSSTYPERTITKSSMFHASQIYAPLLKMKPNPKIFSTISMVYIPKNK